MIIRRSFGVLVSDNSVCGEGLAYPLSLVIGLAHLLLWVLHSHFASSNTKLYSSIWPAYGRSWGLIAVFDAGPFASSFVSTQIFQVCLCTLYYSGQYPASKSKSNPKGGTVAFVASKFPIEALMDV